MPWQWKVWGKHPAFKDYFQLGPEDPLINGMAEWMKSGYALVKIERTTRHFFSWRFWMRGLRKESLACGLLRDSSDQLGRPYPILVMGTGSLPNWEKNWDLLPLAFEDSWNQMENLMVRSYKTIKNLEEELFQITSPCGEWEKMSQRRGQKENIDMEEQIKKNLPKETFFITLNQSDPLEPIILVSLYHYFWRKWGEPIPNSIFMGGSLAKTFLVFYRRPLIPQDFQDIWSDSIVDR